MIDKQYLIETADSYGLSISEEAAEKFCLYAKILVEWNEKMNLTAITQPREIADKHFIDSLLFFLAYQPKEGSSIIDIGSGAGFPSVPLKIVRPDLRLTLLDSLNKRITFLNALAEELRIEINAIHGRAEELSRKKPHREEFDIATARAVAALPVLCEYCIPFVKPGGVFVAMKGSEAQKELNEALGAVKTLGGKVESYKELFLPDGSKRGIIVIKKISQTPTKYPRQGAKILKSPL